MKIAANIERVRSPTKGCALIFSVKIAPMNYLDTSRERPHPKSQPCETYPGIEEVTGEQRSRGPQVMRRIRQSEKPSPWSMTRRNFVKRSVSFIGLCTNHVGFICHNHCRFCVLGRKRTNNIPFSNVVALVDRLREWKDEHRPENFRVFINYFRAMNWDPKTLASISQLNRRLGEGAPELMMGGIEFKTDKELESWLQERRDLGINVIRLSLAGTQPLHDKWVGRQGDFEFNLRAARMAAELGFKRDEWLLVSRSTIPHLEELTAQLDEIPGRAYRGFRMITWGRSKKLEAQERITRNIYNELPEWVRKDFQLTPYLKTEREWVEEVQHLPDEEPPEPFYLILNLKDALMPRLESSSSDEIIEDLENRSRRIYEAAPTMKDLGARHGNKGNDWMYHRSEIQQEWIRRFLHASQLEFEQGLTWIV
jgi:hypothetical protein